MHASKRGKRAAQRTWHAGRVDARIKLSSSAPCGAWAAMSAARMGLVATTGVSAFRVALRLTDRGEEGEDAHTVLRNGEGRVESGRKGQRQSHQARRSFIYTARTDPSGRAQRRCRAQLTHDRTAYSTCVQCVSQPLSSCPSSLCGWRCVLNVGVDSFFVIVCGLWIVDSRWITSTVLCVLYTSEMRN